ncbi:MAG: hypothetical protein JO112_05810 [Planctomycetes bacterium]|nr:hypothetical protein [Planctomycetota bacterium]
MICPNSGVPGLTVSLNACASFFSDIVTTMPRISRIASGIFLRAASRLAARVSWRSGSTS